MLAEGAEVTGTEGVRVRIPQIEDIGAALEVYYSRITLTNADIRRLFGRSLANGTMAKLRRLARQEEDRAGIIPTNPATVSTAAAYTAWGIDVAELERRWRGLQRMRKGAAG